MSRYKKEITGGDNENKTLLTELKGIRNFLTRSGSKFGSSLTGTTTRTSLDSLYKIKRNSSNQAMRQSVSMPKFDYQTIRPTPVVWLNYRACNDSRESFSTNNTTP